MVCEVTCEDDELQCPGGTDSNGCKENDYCHPKGTGFDGPCPGYCPFDCSEEESRCPVPDDPVTGCAVPPLCIPISKDNKGNSCDDQQCPLVCDIDHENFCTGAIGHTGCKEPDTCIPKCVEACPVTCKEDEIRCKGATDCETGCIESDVCKPKAKNVNNEDCADSSASHECPIHCCDGTVLCPAETDSVGCLAPQTCTPTSKGMNNATCPHHSDCPTICEPNEVKCIVTATDENGCKLPDECIEQGRAYDGELCSVHCPITCGDNEVWCPGQRNVMGCLEPDKCIKKPVKTQGNDKGGLCPGWCPPVCAPGQLKCPSQLDPCDGCPTEEVCVVAAEDLNGELCAVDPLSESHGCPVLCDDLHGEVLCPSNTNLGGCKDPAVCMARTVDYDGNYCPAHSVCPANCDAGEATCHYGIDSRGCQEAAVCIPRGNDSDGELCPKVCPPSCSSDKETLVSVGFDAKGCQLAPICQSLE